jgi:hypothetical protein
LEKSDCTAIVVPSNGATQCFRRTSIEISNCLPNNGYNLYTRSATAQAPSALSSLSGEQPALVV